MSLGWDKHLGLFLSFSGEVQFQIVEVKTLESLLHSKEIKPASPKGNLTLNIHWKD